MFPQEIAVILRPVLLILGAMMIITIIVLQLYWWNFLKKLCGSESDTELQDELRTKEDEELSDVNHENVNIN